MDKIQKFFVGLWRVKERIVLVALLGFLAFRVYQLFVPQTLEAGSTDQKGEAEPPQPAPNNPAPDAPGQYAALYNSNAFTYYSDAPVDSGGGLTPKEAGIELLDLKQGPGGAWRARLKTGAARKWYNEGEEFEEFKVESINPDEKTVVVYAERFAKTVTLRLP